MARRTSSFRGITINETSTTRTSMCRGVTIVETAEDAVGGADVLPRGLEETESGNVGLSRAMQDTDIGFIA